MPTPRKPIRGRSSSLRVFWPQVPRGGVRRRFRGQARGADGGLLARVPRGAVEIAAGARARESVVRGLVLRTGAGPAPRVAPRPGAMSRAGHVRDARVNARRHAGPGLRTGRTRRRIGGDDRAAHRGDGPRRGRTRADARVARGVYRAGAGRRARRAGLSLQRARANRGRATARGGRGAVTKQGRRVGATRPPVRGGRDDRPRHEGAEDVEPQRPRGRGALGARASVVGRADQGARRESHRSRVSGTGPPKPRHV
mmetsp:Transcript_25593/g.76842  ORF Transcript_25593/g.76842 Transcript_25593/m.76842 type:complete len:255 (+) Transcript_25593:2096-2860(+)